MEWRRYGTGPLVRLQRRSFRMESSSIVGMELTSKSGMEPSIKDGMAEIWNRTFQYKAVMQETWNGAL
jgi:hypothetical protein